MWVVISSIIFYYIINVPNHNIITIVLLTVWKCHDFSIAQILHEINFWDSRSAKYFILTHLEARNCGFNEFLHFLKAEISQSYHFQSP